MGGKVDGAALVRFLEEFAAVESAFSDEVVVVFLAEVSGGMESIGDDTDGLELSPGIRDCFLVDGKGLRKELVCDFFEFTLVCDLAAEEEETE